MTIRETIYTKARILFLTRVLYDDSYNLKVTNLINLSGGKYDKENTAVNDEIEREKKSIEESERVTYNEFLSVYDDIEKLNKQISRKIRKKSPDYPVVTEKMEEIQSNMKRFVKPYERRYSTSPDIRYGRIDYPFITMMRVTFRYQLYKGTVFDSLTPYFEKYHIDS